jgi:hypothetical protein
MAQLFDVDNRTNVTGDLRQATAALAAVERMIIRPTGASPVVAVEDNRALSGPAGDTPLFPPRAPVARAHPQSGESGVG